MPNTTTPKLKFGTNPYDLCPQTRDKFHVICEKGFIHAKYTYGHTGEMDAWRRSERTPDITYRVIDTADGSCYAILRNGEDLD